MTTEPRFITAMRPPPLDAVAPIIVNFLLDNPAAIKSALGYLYLLAAVERGDADKTGILLDLGIDPNLRPGARDSIEINGSKISILSHATDKFAWAVEEGCTPLMLAARSGSPEAPKIIKLLIQRGANPSERDFHTWTALLRAAWNGREQNVRALLDGANGRSSDVNELDRSGWSAVMRAAWNAHHGTLRLLLNRGAPIDAKDRYGQTALILAASLGHSDVVKLLLEKGADWKITDGKNQTAISLAENFRHAATARILRDWISANAPMSAAAIEAVLGSSSSSSKGKETTTATTPLPARTNGKLSFFTEVLNAAEQFAIPTPRPLTVPGAYGDPDPEPEEPSTPDVSSQAEAPYRALLPVELQESLEQPTLGNAIHPDVAVKLADLLKRLASAPQPSESTLLEEFARMNDVNTTSTNVRDGVVKRMEAVRHLRDGISNFASFLVARDLLRAESEKLADEAQSGVAEKDKELTKLDEVSTLLTSEKSKALQDLETTRARLAGLQETLGMPAEAATATSTASTRVSSEFDRRQAGLQADRARTEREKDGYLQSAVASSAVAVHLAKQIDAARASKDSLEQVLAGAEEEHAGYLRELVSRSLKVLHSIRRGLEVATEEAEQALAMGLHSRHDRLKAEHRGLEVELEEARRLKQWYERCLSELEHTEAPKEPEPEAEQGKVEVAPETPVTSASAAVPAPASSHSEVQLPDAVSQTENSSLAEPITEQGLRHLSVPETEPDTTGIQMIDVDLHSGAPSIAATETAETSEVDSDESFVKVGHGEAEEEELEVREEDPEDGTKKLVLE